ncbi:MAG: chitobiase/beta-hexosaminidase C-terminal domain-containing protein [Lachnospiraceae bacterium]|nr:chitobiase/beta-hexosaminidase C-terminal domain-containing protein [Lachnospiraceae bacterium]
MKNVKRKTALFLALAIAFTSLPELYLSAPETVQAAEPIAAVTYDGSVQNYYSFSSLTNDVDGKYKGQKITIDMLRSWNAAGDEDFNRRLFVSAKSSVTLNMHGFVFNRNNAYKGKDKYNGELILVDKGASLVVNGGTEEERNHVYKEIALYNTNNPSGDKASDRGTFKGGLLTGGCSCDGAGGIHARANTTVILNDVTIAGCGQTRYGKGGGIWMWDDNARLVLNNSRVTGCYASSYGGGICIMDDDQITIELNNSSVDHNYAGNRGGGIYTDGEKCHVIGRNGAEVCYNNSGDYGGGVCVWDANTAVSGLIIHNNSTQDGGGVYTDDVSITLSNLTIKQNYSSRNGGGAFIYNNKNTISGCEITNNTAAEYGGGVYVRKNVREGFVVSGKTIVRNNYAKKLGDNFFISDSKPTDSRVNFKLTKGADVHFIYGWPDGSDSYMVTEGKVNDTIKTPNCIQYLSSDNRGYHFTYNPSPNQRKIYLVKDGKDSASTGSKYEKPVDPTNVEATDTNNASATQDGGGTKAGIVGKVGPGGGEGDDYYLIRGFSHHQSTSEDMHDADNVFYYSDAFFDENPKTYNGHLATASLSMAFSGMYLRNLEDEDENGNRYYNKHAGIRQFLADIGCPDQSITINESMEKVPGIDTIGVTIANKRLAKTNEETTGYILVPVVVRGGGYEREWGSNATIGKASTSNRDKEAQGFSEAADQVVMEVEKYITKYQLQDMIEEGRVKFWVTGYSRAGATANITSKRLVEHYACDATTPGKNNQVFCYTCEAPMGGTDEAEQLDDKTHYYCIHNLVNAVDIVPLVAPELMGFKRYGVDHYIPGKNYSSEVRSKVSHVNRGGASGASVITTYYDNEIDYVKNGVGDTYKNKMLSQLKTIDSAIVFDDYFHPMTMSFIPGMKISEAGVYENDVEAFVRDFIRYAMEGNDPSKPEHWTQAVKHRDNFADNIQPALRDTLAVVFSMSDDVSNSFMERAGTLMSKLNTFTGTVSLLDIYLEIIGGDELHYSPNPEYLAGWSHTHEERRKSIIDYFWQILNETGALEGMDKSDVSALQQAWPKLADFAFILMEADDKYYPGSNESGKKWAKDSGSHMMLLGTFATYAGYILMNHYPEINLAWARAYDSYYDNETTEYRITKVGYRPAAPTATARDAEGRELILTKGEGTINRLYGDQKIILDIPTIVGEAIYYDLRDDTAKKQLTTNLCYRGGIDLIVDEDEKTETDYTITCYGISYGVKSEKAVYKLKFDPRHKVVVTDGAESEEEYSYFAKQAVTLAPAVPDHEFFKYWEINLVTKDGTVLCECAEELLGDQCYTQNASFVMPRTGDTICEQTVPSGYALVAIWHAEEKIRNIEVYPDRQEDIPIVPRGGEDLAVIAGIQYTSGEGESAREWGPMMGSPLITWSREYEENGEKKEMLVPVERDEDGSQLASKADYGTVYIATVHISQNADKNTVFMDNEHLSTTLRDAEGTYTSIKATRDDADGSATVVIKFRATESGPTPEPPDPVRIRANRKDVNSGQEAAGQVSYIAIPDKSVALMAPDVPDEQFKEWDLKGELEIDPDSQTSVTDRMIVVIVPEGVGTDELEIDILYYPVIKKIDLALKAPVTDEEMQMNATDQADSETMKVTIGNTYVIHPDYVRIDWSPAPIDGESGEKIADQDTEYTATVSLVPKKDESQNDYFEAKEEGGSEYVRMSGIFAISPNAEVSLNGETATLNAGDWNASYTFPKTERLRYTLVSVTAPDDVSGLPHGTSEAEIRKLLPETVKLLVDTGMEIDGDVTWTLESDETAEKRNAVVWTATGDVQLPSDVVNPDDVPLDPVFHLMVNEADHASSPMSTLPTGTYLADQVTTLETTEEGGTTYYTTDGEEPTVSSTEYQGEEILICRNDPNLKPEYWVDEEGETHYTGRWMFILKAFTVKDGLWDSPVMTYVYTFDNAVPIPEGKEYVYTGEEQTLLTIDNFYTVVETALPQGCHLDENGNPVAKDAGTYELTLHIDDGFVWLIESEDDEGNVTQSSTTDDQKVTYTIHTASLEDAEIRVLEEPFPLDKDTGVAEPEIELTLYDVVIDPENYDVFYADNMEPGAGLVWAVGKKNCEGETKDSVFGIYTDEDYAFSYDPVPDQTYTGKAIKPQVTVYYAGTRLTEKKDYTITYHDNVNATDMAGFTIKGKGNYSGQETGSFVILQKDVADEDVSISQIEPVTYNPAKPKVYLPVPKISYNRTNLKKDRDFIVRYYTDAACTKMTDTPKKIGRYYVKIKGKAGSNYTGEAFLEFDILDPKLTPVSKLSVNKIPDQVFTGKFIEVKDLGLVVKDGRNELTIGEEYEAFCYGYEPGKANVIITGNEEKGYTGRRFVEFNIKGFPLSKAVITRFESSVPYNGQEIKQELILTYQKVRGEEPVRLIEGTDYFVSYSDNVNAGTASMTLTGNPDRGYTGSIKKNFRIQPASIDAANITISMDDSYAYEKGGVKPAPVVTAAFDGLDEPITLVSGRDYQISYKNNKDLHNGTDKNPPTVILKGKGNYKDTNKTKTFAITTVSMIEAEVFADANDLIENTRADKWKSAVTLIDADGNKLTAGKDYDKNSIIYSYSADGSDPIPDGVSVLAGTRIYITVPAKQGSPYTGEAKGSYRILAQGKDIGKLRVTVDPKPYTGKVVKLLPEDIHWTSGNKPVDVTCEVDGTVYEKEKDKYTNNGRVKVTVYGTGEWGGRKEITYYIGPRGFLWWWRF